MAIVTMQEQVNGARNYSVTVNITGDGAEANETIVDTGYLNIDTVSIWRIQGQADTFAVRLLWAGSQGNAVAWEQNGGRFWFDFEKTGGIKNPRAPGYTGDLILQTIGLAAGEVGALQIDMKKKGVPR